MQKKDFEATYCRRSNITKPFYDKWFITLPCACDCTACEGWAAVGRSDGAIKAHTELYAPNGGK